jgi:hypothetical protein
MKLKAFSALLCLTLTFCTQSDLEDQAALNATSKELQRLNNKPIIGLFKEGKLVISANKAQLNPFISYGIKKGIDEGLIFNSADPLTSEVDFAIVNENILYSIVRTYDKSKTFTGQFVMKLENTHGVVTLSGTCYSCLQSPCHPQACPINLSESGVACPTNVCTNCRLRVYPCGGDFE